MLGAVRTTTTTSAASHSSGRRQIVLRHQTIGVPKEESHRRVGIRKAIRYLPFSTRIATRSSVSPLPFLSSSPVPCPPSYYLSPQTSTPSPLSTCPPMTEYDYSPAAYERYMAQQSRVSNWVRETNKHPLANPYLLSPTPRDRTFYDSSDDDTIVFPRTGGPLRSKTLRSQEGYDSTSSSSRPSRSRTRLPTYADHPRQPEHRGRELRQSSTRHRSQSHSRSPSSRQTLQGAYPQRTAQSYSYSQHHVPPASHGRYRTPGPAIYQYPAAHGSTPARPVYTAPPPGHLYYPSHGGQPRNSSRDQFHRGYSHPRQPTRSQPPPYNVVPGGGPKADYKHGVRLSFTHVLVLVLIASFFLLLHIRFDPAVLPSDLTPTLMNFERTPRVPKSNLSPNAFGCWPTAVRSELVNRSTSIRQYQQSPPNRHSRS